MTKVVYNACHGGFGLSNEAVERYAAIKGITLYIKKPDDKLSALSEKLSQRNSYYTSLDFEYANRFDEDNLKRHDPVLVQVVEELGEKADGRFAHLVIEDVPTGAKYRIQEYDGKEWVEREDQVEWEVA